MDRSEMDDVMDTFASHHTKLVGKISPNALTALHGGLTNVANNNPQEFNAHPDFRIQTDIIEAEMTTRGLTFLPIP